MKQLIIKLNIISTGLLLVLITNMHAQVYKQKLDDYTFFGVHSSYVYFSKGNTDYSVDDTPVTYVYCGYPSYELGGVIRVFKTKKLNFYTGFFARHLYMVSKEYIESKQAANFPYAWTIELDFGANLWSVPFRMEYFVYKKLFVYTSIVPGFYHEYGGSGYSQRNNIEIFDYNYERKKTLYMNSEFGFGIYLPSKFVLFQPYVYYNKSFRDMWVGNLVITGIKNKPYTEVTGKLKQSGNFIGFGLNIYPKKFWKRK